MISLLFILYSFFIYIFILLAPFLWNCPYPIAKHIYFLFVKAYFRKCFIHLTITN